MNHSYYCLDWSRIPEINEEGSFDFLFDLMEEEEMPGWISEVAFGKQIDGYFFSSWVGLMEFKDWFDLARPSMDPAITESFAALFQDVGLLMNDDFAFVPIMKDILFEDDWLLAAIPPDEVGNIISRANEIDLCALVPVFQAALDRHPSDLIESGELVRDWLVALKEGLTAVEERRFGIILGTA